MRQVVVLRGISGAGKTTYGRHLALEANLSGRTAEIVSADHHFERSGFYVFDPTDLEEAHASCFRRFLEATARGTNLVIVDNTNIRLLEASPYMLGARAAGYEAKIVEIQCPTETAARRNVHKVPSYKVAKMANTLQSEPLPPWWESEVIPFEG